MCAAWPAGLLRLLDGHDLEARVGIIVQLMTVDDDGWPHVALLSAGEVVFQPPDRALLALWPQSSTSGNLIARRLALLCVAFEGAWWLARLEVVTTGPLADLQEPRLGVLARLVHLRADTVPYAQLDGSLHFQLTDPSEVVSRWRRTIISLRAAYQPPGQDPPDSRDVGP